MNKKHQHPCVALRPTLIWLCVQYTGNINGHRSPETLAKQGMTTFVNRHAASYYRPQQYVAPAAVPVQRPVPDVRDDYESEDVSPLAVSR